MKEKLIKLLQSAPKDIVENHVIEELAEYLIANGVAIPIRCKNCEYWDEEWKNWRGNSKCKYLNICTRKDGFCSHAEENFNK